jgi:hypothetical protein
MAASHSKKEFKTRKRSRKMNKGYKGGYKSGLYDSDDYYVVNGEYGLEIHAKDPTNEIYVTSFPTAMRDHLLRTNKHLQDSGKTPGDLLSYLDVKGGRKCNTRRNNCKSVNIRRR